MLIPYWWGTEIRVSRDNAVPNSFWI